MPSSISPRTSRPRSWEREPGDFAEAQAVQAKYGATLRVELFHVTMSLMFMDSDLKRHPEQPSSLSVVAVKCP